MYGSVSANTRRVCVYDTDRPAHGISYQNHFIRRQHAEGGLILHGDQDSQYTSEWYFNILKNECTNLYGFRAEDELYQTEEEFAYATYNHVRPHSYNGYRTPYQAQMAA